MTATAPWEETQRNEGRKPLRVWLDAEDVAHLARLRRVYGTDAQAVRVAIRRLADADGP